MEVKMTTSLALFWFLFSQAYLLLCITAGTDNILFVVEETNITRMCSEQPLLMVNGTFPGPTITVTRGDTVSVTVLNKGPYPITIHWHGVKQHRNPWSDGPEYITQTPISANGGSFTYKVVFSNEEGTLWWHAHSDWSRASVHGAIIVLPLPNKKYPFNPQPDHTQTIMLGSWFNNRNLMEEYQASVISGGDIDAPTSFTINGYPGQLNTSCVDDIYKLVVDSGKTYHLRIINAVMDEDMFFAISGHYFTVVGMDGAYITPIYTNYMMITPGQTMDILLITNQTSGIYHMGASPFVDHNFGSATSVSDEKTTAILQYSDYNGTEVIDELEDLLQYASNNVTSANAFTNKIKGLTGNADYPITVPTDSDINKNFTITISVNTLPCPYTPNNCSGPSYTDGTNGLHAASLNNQRFVAQSISILQAYRCNITGVYTEDFPTTPESFDWSNATGDYETVPIAGTKVMTVEYGDAVEMVFQGTNVGNAENHPMHVHGFNFYLVGSDAGNFNESSRSQYNTVDPAEVNTFGVPRNGWLAVRFWAKNPGVWFLHCHLERHASWGMAGVLIVKNKTNAVDESLLDPPADYPACP